MTTVHAKHIAVVVAVFHAQSSSQHPGLKVLMVDYLGTKFCGFFEQRDERRVFLHGLQVRDASFHHDLASELVVGGCASDDDPKSL